MVHPSRIRKWTWEHGRGVRIQQRSQHTVWGRDARTPRHSGQSSKSARSFK